MITKKAAVKSLSSNHSISHSNQNDLANIMCQEVKKYMKFKPLGDYVLVSHAKEEEKTSGGIIIPDAAKEKPQEGKVIAVGPGRRDRDGKRVATEVKIGDRILYGKYSGTEIKLDGEDRIIMKEDEIFCIL
jgi:chaperonin GroES